MKVLLALLATLVGIAMVGGGVYGIVKGGDDDDEPSSTSSAEASTPATLENISPSKGECDDVARRDPRLAHLDDLRLQATDAETGIARADLICNGGTVVLIVRMQGLRETETTKFLAWLYNDRSDAKQVGTVIGSDRKAFGSVTIGSEVDTTRYESLVFSSVPFGEFEDRPRRIVFRAPL